MSEGRDLDSLPGWLAASRALARSVRGRIYASAALPLVTGVALLTVTQSQLLGGVLAGGLAGRGPGFGPSLAALALIVAASLALRIVAYTPLLAACTDAALGAEADPRASWRFTMQPATLRTIGLATALVACGLVLLVVPALVAASFLAFTVPVLRAEGLTDVAALRRSERLARAGIGRTTAVALVGPALAYLANVVVQAPFIAAQQVIVWRNADAGANDPQALTTGLLWMQLPAVVLGTFVEVAVMVSVAAALAVLFARYRSAIPCEPGASA